MPRVARGKQGPDLLRLLDTTRARVIGETRYLSGRVSSHVSRQTVIGVEEQDKTL